MNTYEKWANMLLILHNIYFDLVLKKFPKTETIKQDEYEEKIDVNDYIGNKDVFKNKIIYKEKEIGSKKLIRPSILLYSSKKYGDFRIEYRSYSGIVAYKASKKVEYKIEKKVPKEKLKMKWGKGDFWEAKHGLFDLYLDAGDRYIKLYNGDATHYNVFKDLERFASYDECYQVWSGEEINIDERNIDKTEALLSLFVLMLEQEINYGELDFQQTTNFSISEGFRPRDMIMGFLHMMYHNPDDFKSYPFWSIKKGVKSSPHFGKDQEKRYSDLEEKYKKHFEKFRNNNRDVNSIFKNVDIKNAFIKATNDANQNPSIKKLETLLNTK
ncbi:hypothetical protein ACQKOM_21925 [Peribacillus frigoritolerans]|uniref:hypothetical protein n=1 Tax=Peribacillus frigoritolerans TaxID=450367 RepID=UPI003D0506B2